MTPASTELAIVLNPEAQGKSYDERRIKSLRAIAGSRAVIFSTERRDLVDAVAEGVRERGVGTVAVIGGDGTISNVLTALHRAYGDAPLPRIALLRGGTMNTTANAFDVPRKQPEELLRRLLAARAETIVARATLKVEGRLGFLFSTGAMVGFLDALYESRESGRLAARALAARTRQLGRAHRRRGRADRAHRDAAVAQRRASTTSRIRRGATRCSRPARSRASGSAFGPFPRAVECQNAVPALRVPRVAADARAPAAAHPPRPTDREWPRLRSARAARSSSTPRSAVPLRARRRHLRGERQARGRGRAADRDPRRVSAKKMKRSESFAKLAAPSSRAASSERQRWRSCPRRRRRPRQRRRLVAAGARRVRSLSIDARGRCFACGA